MNGDRQRLRGHYDEDFYWERVDRNLGWLGDTTEEQRERQARLRDAVIGIVGTGGIGGAAAARLVRMGALNLKLADPDHFDLTNVQRQYGAGRDTIGRNKAEVVAEQVFALTGDVNIDVFPEGITPDVIHRLMERIMPEHQDFPSPGTLDEWFVEKQTMPIFGACPPLAEGVLVERLAQEIMDLPGRTPLPVQPGYALFDTLTWEAKTVEKAWWAK